MDEFAVQGGHVTLEGKAGGFCERSVCPEGKGIQDQDKGTTPPEPALKGRGWKKRADEKGWVANENEDLLKVARKRLETVPIEKCCENK